MILMLGAVLCWGYPNQAQANGFGTQITIYDGSSSLTGDPWYTRHTEDQEVEPGCTIHQMWDLEGMFLNKTKLTMVGGWNFIGKAGNFVSGDIFIDTDKDAKFGVPGSTSTSNSAYKFNYVLHMNWTGGTYDVYQIGDNAKVSLVYYLMNQGSNPFAYVSDGTLVSSGNKFVYQSGLTDVQTGFVGAGPNMHYSVEVDLGFLKANERNILAHFTMGCGNDNLVGQGTVVPIPGAILLLGAGLTRLAAYVRRRQD